MQKYSVSVLKKTIQKIWTFQVFCICKRPFFYQYWYMLEIKNCKQTCPLYIHNSDGWEENQPYSLKPSLWNLKKKTGFDLDGSTYYLSIIGFLDNGFSWLAFKKFWWNFKRLNISLSNFWSKSHCLVFLLFYVYCTLNILVCPIWLSLFLLFSFSLWQFSFSHWFLWINLILTLSERITVYK